MDSYNSFAEYYDELMEDARYPERCRYILQTAERFGHSMGRTLDLACGTGSLTLELKKSGVDVFGADGSVEMLSEAMQKSLREGFHILFVIMNMQELELPEKIDTCVCTLDSINHMTDEADVQKTFDGVSRYMNAGGLLIFDVNTVYKFLRTTCLLPRAGEYIACGRISRAKTISWIYPSTFLRRKTACTTAKARTFRNAPIPTQNCV